MTEDDCLRELRTATPFTRQRVPSALGVTADSLAPDANRCFTVLRDSHLIASRFAPVNCRSVRWLMEIDFPTRAETLGWLVVYVLPALVAIFFGRRALLRGAFGWRATAASTALGFATILVALVAFGFIYPHGHHDTLWINSRPELNYRIDVLLGLVVFALGVVAWKLPRPVAAR